MQQIYHGNGKKIEWVFVEEARDASHRIMNALSTIHVLLLMWMRAVWILKLSHQAYMIFRKRRTLTVWARWWRRQQHFCKYCHSVWISLRCSCCAFALQLLALIARYSDDDLMATWCEYQSDTACGILALDVLHIIPLPQY